MTTLATPTQSSLAKPLLFIAITFALSWPLAFGGFSLGLTSYSRTWFVVAITFMFTPMLAALIVQKLIYRQPVLAPLAVSFRPNRWFLPAILLPPFIAVVATALSLLFPGVHLSPDPMTSNAFTSLTGSLSAERLAQVRQQLASLPAHPFLLTLLAGTFAGITINAVAGFGEELGWRGLLQPQLAHLGFWRSSLLIGTVWGIWHAPFILHGYNYPGYPILGIFMMTLWTTLFTPLIAYVRIRSNSTIAAAIMHGALNGTAGAPAVILHGGTSLTAGTMGLPGLLVLVVLNAVLWLTFRPTSESLNS